MDKHKTLIALGLIIVVGLALYGSAYWGQRRAHESQTKADAAFLLLIRKQSECYEIRDWDCTKRINTALAYLTAIRWRIIRDYGLVDDSVAPEVDEFLAWHESLPPLSLASAEQAAAEKCKDPGQKSDCPSSDAIRPVPYFVNGEIQGYRVYPGSNRDEFDSIDLELGDLITQFEGQALTNVELVTELLDELSSGRPVQVTVETEGVSRVIELQAD